MPSKQIAILIDTSGSMYVPASPGGPDKIERAIEGAKLFIEAVIARIFEINAGPDSEIIKRTQRRIAVSVHRFAVGQQVLPGAAQVDFQLVSAATEISLPSNVQDLRIAPDVLADQAANAAVVGDLTNLYGAVHHVADFLANPANAPDWAVDHKVILLLSDGIQTVPSWNYTQAQYESDNGVDFDDVLDDDSRNISLVAWGIGSDALPGVLSTLVADADAEAGLSFADAITDSDPLSPDMVSPFADAMTELIDDNGILPLQPVGGTPSGYRWEQFTLPHTDRRPEQDKGGHPCGNAAEFEFESDEANEAILATLVAHDDGAPSLELVSPSGAVFASWTPGVRVVHTAHATSLKVTRPEPGTWRAWVHGDPRGRTLTLDLLVRGVLPSFKVAARAEPAVLKGPGKTEIYVSIVGKDDKPIPDGFRVAATVDGKTTTLDERLEDGRIRGPVEIRSEAAGSSKIRVEVTGKLDGKPVRRWAFATVQHGKVLDPRLAITPSRLEIGSKADLKVTLRDGAFTEQTQLAFGDGVLVHSLKRVDERTLAVRVQVDPAARAGSRHVVSFSPHAETVDGLELFDPKAPTRRGRLEALHYDALGKLVAITWQQGRRTGIGNLPPALLERLERALAADLEVDLDLDATARVRSIVTKRPS